MIAALQLGRISFAQGVFAYEKQRKEDRDGPRDVLVWCTCCHASLLVDGDIEHKIEIGMLWQRVHNRSSVKGPAGGFFVCPFVGNYIVEIPR